MTAQEFYNRAWIKGAGKSDPRGDWPFRMAEAYAEHCKSISQGPAREETPQLIWLVELFHEGKSEGWWVGPPKSEGGWRTDNAWAAKRYTEAEAKAVAAALDYFPAPFRWSHWVATEHVFIGKSDAFLEYVRPSDGPAGKGKPPDLGDERIAIAECLKGRTMPDDDYAMFEEGWLAARFHDFDAGAQSRTPTNLESRTAPDTASREPHDGWMNAWMYKNVPRDQNCAYLWNPEARKFAGDWADFRVANLESRTVAPQNEIEVLNAKLKMEIALRKLAERNSAGCFEDNKQLAAGIKELESRLAGAAALPSTPNTELLAAADEAEEWVRLGIEGGAAHRWRTGLEVVAQKCRMWAASVPVASSPTQTLLKDCEHVILGLIDRTANKKVVIDSAQRTLLRISAYLGLTATSSPEPNQGAK